MTYALIALALFVSACQTVGRFNPPEFAQPAPGPASVSTPVVQTAETPSRFPAGAKAVDESVRVFGRSTFQIDADIELRNETVYQRTVSVAGKPLATEDGGEVVCSLAAYVPARTALHVKAGTPYALEWSRFNESVLGVFQEFDNTKLVDARAVVSCALRAPGTPWTSPLDQTQVSASMLEQSLGFKFIERTEAPPIQAEPIKYSPGDEKILKEYSI